MNNTTNKIENDLFHALILARLEDLSVDATKMVEYIKAELADVVQECYLQCLVIECGEGECALAIATKFPDLVSRHEPKDLDNSDSA